MPYTENKKGNELDSLALDNSQFVIVIHPITGVAYKVLVSDFAAFLGGGGSGNFVDLISNQSIDGNKLFLKATTFIAGLFSRNSLSITGYNNGVPKEATIAASTGMVNSIIVQLQKTGGTVAYLSDIPVDTSSEVAANTAARHIHSNKTLLDSFTQKTGISYNGSNGIITYTDETGTPTAIDLPIENLFENASYNSTTKNLTLTTNAGGTINIPLADLVDLPEVQIGTTNPGTTPTTGQRLYIRSDNGNYWVSNGSAWVGPYIG